MSSTDVSFIASQALARSRQALEGEDAEDDGTSDRKSDAMADLERQTRAPEGFVTASSGSHGGDVPRQDIAAVVINPDALDIEVDD